MASKSSFASSKKPQPASRAGTSSATDANTDMDFTGGLPLLPLDDDSSQQGSSGFDFAAFLSLQEQDVDYDYFAEETTSTSASSLTLATSHSPDHMMGLQQQQPPSPSMVKGSEALQPRHRLERRGHTKSRRGCFNCKRRRIKCQETRPACGHCTKTGLKCEYPTVPQVVHQPQHQVPLFSLQDMRFFQHFLFQCYPTYPHGAESIWTHEIPSLSEKYEYLMHAILGLAASELSSDDQRDPSLLAAAMAHRVKAIKALKRAIAGASRADTFEEGNALMATCFALTFQSVLLDDGMIEYMTFIRGVIIVSIQMYCKGAKFLFGNFLGEAATQALEPFMQQVPVIETSWTDAAALSIRALEPLCKHEIERGYQQGLAHIAEQLYVSSWSAYQGISKQYAWWMMLPHDKFQYVIDLGNQTCVLLATHWIALMQIMATITEIESKARAKQPEPHKDRGIGVGIIRWLKFLNRMVDIDYLSYNQWPLWVEAQLDRDMAFFGKTR